MTVWVVNLFGYNCFGEPIDSTLCGVFTTTALAFERAQTTMTDLDGYPWTSEFYHITEPWGFTIQNAQVKEVWCEIVGVTLNE